MTRKPPRCKAPGCRKPSTQTSGLTSWCSPECGAILAQAKLAKARQVKAKTERKADKLKRESLKTRRDYIREAQFAFNKFVRLRDAGRPCICCGRTLSFGGVGGLVDAGHYRSVGSAPHLRFVEDNCHAQLAYCNRYGAGRSTDYRIGLIERIGHARLDALESDQEPRKYSIQDLIEIRDNYRAKCKELEHPQ